MSISQVRTLFNYYLKALYQVYPIIDKKTIFEFGTRVTIEKGFGNNIESCVIFMVLALGSFVAYQHGETQWGHEGTHDVVSPVGIGFFNKGRQILAFLAKGHIRTAQCHVLAGYWCSDTTCNTFG